MTNVTNISDIQHDLETARAVLLASLEGVTQEQFDRPPPGEVTDEERRWPIVEVLWHVGALEDRFRRAIDQAIGGRPILADPPRPRPAHLTTPAPLLEWIEQSRRPTEALLRRMTEADLDVEMKRPDGSIRTPRWYLRVIANHDRAHAEQVRDLRALEPLPADGKA